MDPIRSIYEGDPDMMEIVREFAVEAAGRADQVQSHLESGDLDALQTVAHQLKGAGGGYGFDCITEVAAKLEAALKDGASDGEIKDCTAALCETLRAVTVSEAD